MRFSLLILPSMSFLCFPFNKTKAQRSFKVVPLISFQTRYWFQSLFPWPVFCSPPSASVGSKPWQFLEVGADLKVAPTQGEQGETVKRHWCSLVCCRCFCSVAKFCPTLCDPVNYSVPGSSVHGIFQARILEWVAVSFSRGSSWLRDQAQVSCTTGRFFTVWITRKLEKINKITRLLKKREDTSYQWTTRKLEKNKQNGKTLKEKGRYKLPMLGIRQMISLQTLQISKRLIKDCYK